MVIYAYENVCQESIHTHLALRGQLSWRHGNAGGEKWKRKEGLDESQRHKVSQLLLVSTFYS